MSLKLKKRGEIWYYSGTVAGRRLRGSTKTSQKSEAEKITNRIETGYLERDRHGPGATLTFAQAVLKYRKLGKVPKYLEDMEDFWKDTLVKNITRGAVKSGAIDRYPTQKGATRNRCFVVPTLAVINHAASLDLCPPLKVDWFPSVKVKKEPVTLEWAQRFAANASPHLGALCYFMFLTGARVTEALNVTWGDVDLTAGRATICMGKLGGKTRSAHLPPLLIAALANIPSNREANETVFTYSTYSSAKDSWAAAIKRAGLKRLTFHSCRHGFATSLLHNGVDPITVARLGGWESAQHVFQTYGHPMDDDTLANRIIDKPVANSPKALVDKKKKSV